METIMRLCLVALLCSPLYAAAPPPVKKGLLHQQFKLAGPEARCRMLQLMGSQGPAAADWAVPIAADALDDGDAKVRAAGAETLGHLGPAAECLVPRLCKMLSDKDPRVRRRCAVAIGTLRSHPKVAVPALTRSLSDPDADKAAGEANVAPIAAIALGAYGPRAESAVPSLLKLLTHKDEGRREAAVYALGKVGAKPGEVVPRLTKMLRDRDHAAIRSRIAQSLGEMGPAAKSALPHLLAAYSCKDIEDGRLVHGIQQSVTAAVVRIGPKDPKVLALLIGICKDPRSDRTQLRHALDAMAKLGPLAVPAVPVLLDLAAADGAHSLLPQLASVVKSIGADAVPQLLRRLKAADVRADRVLIPILGEIGPPAVEAVPALKEKMKSEYADVRVLAKQAVARILSEKRKPKP